MGSPAAALVKRKAEDALLMPPPPVKRIRRPTKVLDEDEYTAALSEIIKRDYFPGLLESQAQQEYLAALESNNSVWIEEAGQKLLDISTSHSNTGRRKRRSTRLAVPSKPPPPNESHTPVADTPRGWSGGETPASTANTEASEEGEPKLSIDTSNLSLSEFQAKYTSEDNESFNALLDRQNQKRREKHAYLWTKDQRIPSARQIAYRAREAKLLDSRLADKASGTALVPMHTGATDSRPAKPDTWRITKPENTLMFNASSIDEEGLTTVMETHEASSKAGPKAVVRTNTRFAPQSLLEDPTGPLPPSPSLNTSIIARRDAARAAASSSDTEFPDGSETPRVNGYAFVDEDEPENVPRPEQGGGPSYRDLLAGQVGDATPNPFTISQVRRREDLHHRLVDKTNKAKRAKAAAQRSQHSALTPAGGTRGTTAGGNMTPAARKLMERINHTPLRSGREDHPEVRPEMWTPRSRVGRSGPKGGNGGKMLK